MTSKQVGFFLLLLAFMVASMIVYFEFKREKFNQKCEGDSDCAYGLKCNGGECKN